MNKVVAGKLAAADLARIVLHVEIAKLVLFLAILKSFHIRREQVASRVFLITVLRLESMSAVLARVVAVCSV